MIGEIAGFDWDDGNWPKCGKHGVSREEIESVLLGAPGMYRDPSPNEMRFRAIGRSLQGRYVFIAFTIRESGGERRIRPVSARYMHHREIKRYEQG
ncbi:hypothetical protein VE25_02095 [Devosia geojensis]|uniref:BrnT family toxin n=1 Tax=Devosia geojensis TaxID=443610 RepID=A0A0F5FYZ1_9HYPH|nr:BrnT family toxin [Devosia geojensis]KKB13422.1 hypothetical protein VE25_02095 [Devosia geojensis]